MKSVVFCLSVVYFFFSFPRAIRDIDYLALATSARTKVARESAHRPRRRRREQWKFLVPCNVIVTCKDGDARSKMSERADGRFDSVMRMEADRMSQTLLNSRDAKQCQPSDQNRQWNRMSGMEAGTAVLLLTRHLSTAYL